MKAIWEWVLNESHWLFDGIGAVLLVSVLGWLWTKFFGKRGEPNIQQKLHGKDSSVNYQVGRDLHQGNGAGKGRRP
ncbi:hypothetical protein [Burkholderia diffusa]|uniref:hypothetical protein n=1 Tax=Burkholderia diffusa TaxID=488732 RepID=UPI002ABD9884|nr:hypothetical protein [Burkholderia diffusa]